jgi:hypothetical protein
MCWTYVFWTSSSVSFAFCSSSPPLHARAVSCKTYQLDQYYGDNGWLQCREVWGACGVRPLEVAGSNPLLSMDVLCVYVFKCCVVFPYVGIGLTIRRSPFEESYPVKKSLQYPLATRRAGDSDIFVMWWRKEKFLLVPKINPGCPTLRQ